MSTWLNNLFARSPFGPFQEHMKKIKECTDRLPVLAEAFVADDRERIREEAKLISRLEHEADKIKNSVRDHLPNTLFMPVSRADLLEVLSSQDAIADEAEDVGVLMTMASVPHEPELDELYTRLVEAVCATCDRTVLVIHSLDELLEASFARREVEMVRDGIVEVCRLEHEADKLQDQMVKLLYDRGLEWPAPHFTLWTKIVEETGAVANAAERAANRLRQLTSR